MIVCSCNFLSDQDVRTACSSAQKPRTPGQVYGCLGCSPQCGRCARTIKKIMDEALGVCGKSCCPGCPHTAATPDKQVLLLDTLELQVEVHGHSQAAPMDAPVAGRAVA